MGIKLNRLKAYKELNNIKNQQEMADLLSISLVSYNAKETGKIDFTSKEVGIIASKFNINPGELYMDSNTLK